MLKTPLPMSVVKDAEKSRPVVLVFGPFTHCVNTREMLVPAVVPCTHAPPSNVIREANGLEQSALLPGSEITEVAMACPSVVVISSLKLKLQ